MANNWEDQKKYGEAMEDMYGESHRIIAWGIFIFCCAAIYPMVMIPHELRGGVYHRMGQESQTHLEIVATVEERLSKRIEFNLQEIRRQEVTLTALEKYLKHRDGGRFIKYINEPPAEKEGL